MIDICQVNIMYSKFYLFNIIVMGSFEFDQLSYFYYVDNDIGVVVIDWYIYYNFEFFEFEVKDMLSKKMVGDFFDSYIYEKIYSYVGVRYDFFKGGVEEVRRWLVMDFFGNVQNVEVDSGKGEINVLFEEEMVRLSRMIVELYI